MYPRPTLSLFTLAVHGLLLLSLVGLVSGFALTVCAQEKEIPAEFKPMFNGNDLTGWVRTNTPAETWAYRDGVLHCTGKPIGELRTDKMFQNFIMELEWRHLVPGGNAGIFVWADDVPARGVPFHRGIEVQVLENSYGNTKGYTTHGDIFPIHGAKMTPINGRGGDRAFPSELLSKPSPSGITTASNAAMGTSLYRSMVNWSREVPTLGQRKAISALSPKVVRSSIAMYESQNCRLTKFRQTKSRSQIEVTNPSIQAWTCEVGLQFHRLIHGKPTTGFFCIKAVTNHRF